MSEPHLKRRIGPGLLTAYGVGVMIGAGIYVLVGAVAAEAGIWAPLAFLVAGIVAAPSALSYAELSTRLPEAAGEAAYIAKGLNSRALSLLVGLAIVLAGTVSAAAVLRGGSGYLTTVTGWPADWTILGIGLALAFVAILGALESLALAALFTVIEVVGLAMVVRVGAGADPSPDWAAGAPVVWDGVAAAAILAFFAFIGFEDIVNMAEEVRDPSRSLPRAILWALVLTSLIYGLVSWAAVRAVPLADLAVSEQPLALVMKGTGAVPILSLIAVVAALNGVLAQIVMAARVLFGLGKTWGGMAVFHRAHPRFGTPVLATVLISSATITAALALPVASLAEVTASVLLAVFVLVNAALIGLKRQNPDAPFRISILVPITGLLLSLVALGVTVLEFL